MIVEEINSSLKGDGLLLEILIEKPSDYKSFAKKWVLDLDFESDYEMLLASRIAYRFLPKSTQLEYVYSSLEELNIPTDIPLKLRVFRENDDMYLRIELLNFAVKMRGKEIEIENKGKGMSI